MAVYTGKLGVALITHSRPEYAKVMLESLAKNTYLDNTDFHLFRDGMTNKFSGRVTAHPSDLVKVRRAFEESALPNKTAHCRPENVSIGIHQFEAYEYMSERYEAVAVIEDDIVLSPHYLRIMRILVDHLHNEPDAFCASPNARREPADMVDVEPHLDELGVTTQNLLGVTFLSDRWQRIRPYFLEYYALIRNIDYRKRPHKKIRELFRSHGHKGMATSQDGGKEMAVLAAGMYRMGLRVNRSFYIGVTGEHGTKKHYDETGWAKHQPYIFQQDATRESFRRV